jgi:isopentenyldiphosphate isomerase
MSGRKLFHRRRTIVDVVLRSAMELVDVVSEDDAVLFKASLNECKRLGLLHRTVAVFVLNTNEELLLQQRSFNDDWMPG